MRLSEKTQSERTTDWEAEKEAAAPEEEREDAEMRLRENTQRERLEIATEEEERAAPERKEGEEERREGEEERREGEEEERKLSEKTQWEREREAEFVAEKAALRMPGCVAIE